MAKHKTIIENESFGLLSHVTGDLWQQGIEVTFLGRSWKVPLYVDLPSNDPTPEPQQVRAHKAFLARTEEFLDSAEAGIVEHYCSLRNVDATAATRAVEMGVRLESISFPYARSLATFGLLCSCDWDEERGLAARFEEGRLVEVGSQDLLL